jgi:hypothetical protein
VDDVMTFRRGLAKMLEISARPDRPCPVNVEQLRGLVTAYLRDCDDELALLPEVAAEPHWNLWDWWDLSTAAVTDTFFVVVVVEPGGLEVASGWAERWALRAFGGREFPDDVRQVVPELDRRFGLPGGSVRVGRQGAEAWLGRGLGLRASPADAADAGA